MPLRAPPTPAGTTSGTGLRAAPFFSSAHAARTDATGGRIDPGEGWGRFQ